MTLELIISQPQTQITGNPECDNIQQVEITCYSQLLEIVDNQCNVPWIQENVQFLNTIKGVGISNIEKTSTVGLVDTYTITYTDGTTSTFDVTNGSVGANGRGIVSIIKTSTQELTDTYTITYTDETNSTFDVTNGLDGISVESITLYETVGLVDTYEIVYSSGSRSYFNVTNGKDGIGIDGRGIVSIIKTSTVGLVDTYTITYSDSTTSTFDVTNGKSAYDIYLAGGGTLSEVEFNASITNIPSHIADTYIHVTTTDKANLASLLNERVITKETTGFTNCENVIVTYNSTTRKVTITGTFEAYYLGEKIDVLVSGWESAAHDDIQGLYFLRYCETGFEFTTTPWTFDCLQIAFVSYNTHQFAIRECHGFMQWQSHKELHDTLGTYRTAGGSLSGVVLNSTTAANRRPDVSATTIQDEDLKSVVNGLSSKLYTQRYLSGATPTRLFNVDQSDIIALNGNIPYYNQNVGGTWQQTPIPNNNYAKLFYVAVPVTSDSGSQSFRYMWVQPQFIGTLAEVQAITTNSYAYGDSALFVSEFVFVGEVIINVSGNNWTIYSTSLLSGTKLGQIASPTGNYLTTVTHDATLAGSGTAGDPLIVVGKTIDNVTDFVEPIDETNDKLTIWDNSLLKWIRFSFTSLKTYLNGIYHKFGGSSFGAKQIIGSTDNQDFGIITNNTERLTVLKGGNVGIGTTNPGAKFEVLSTGSISASKFSVANQTVYLGEFYNNTYSTTTPSIAFFGWNNGDANIGSFGGKLFLGSGGYYDTGATVRMTIDNTNGNVGIGTIYPKSKLQVVGGIQCGDDTAAASANKVGTIRYRATANASYVEMCVQTGAATFQWQTILTNTW